MAVIVSKPFYSSINLKLSEILSKFYKNCQLYCYCIYFIIEIDCLLLLLINCIDRYMAVSLRPKIVFIIKLEQLYIPLSGADSQKLDCIN